MPGVVSVLLIVTGINLILALFVLANKPQAEVNRIFALTALAVAGWTGTNALFQWTASMTAAIIAAEMSSAAALLMSASFLHFSWVYPLRTPGSRGRFYLLWVSMLLLVLLSLWPGAVDRSVELAGTRQITTAAGFYFVALFLLLTTLAAFYSFARHTITLHGSLREQALYVLTGAGVTALFGTLFNLVFPLFGDYRFVWLGPAFSIFFVGGTVYSIIAHHLFDIRVIIKRTVVYSLLLAAISGGYSAVEYLLTELFTSISHNATSTLATNIIGAVVVSLCVHPVRQWLERKIHRLLYHKPTRRSTRSTSHAAGRSD